MKFLILLIFSFSIHANALIFGPTQIIGKVRSFDEKNVLVDSKEVLFTVPRDLIPHKDIKPGQELKLNLSDEQMLTVKSEKK